MIKQIAKGRLKHKCEVCKLKFRHVLWFKGNHLCRRCILKEGNQISLSLPIDKALSKTYTIKPNYGKENRITQGRICFPVALVGKKVKLVLIP